MQGSIEASVGALAGALRAREVSSLELVDACLARIERVNPTLNAVVRLCAERARREARERDAALARGESAGPLHGVPMTLKDSIDTEGVVTTGGTWGRRDFVPETDATVAARLRAAGAILLGKTNTPELTLAFETHNRIYGRTRNPWDPARTPGGSSGGAAAIVAAGGVPFDIGSDTGGSIRQPAHFCGVAGLKPTSGRVSRAGHILPFGGLLDLLTTLGPIARGCDDLERLLGVIAGPDFVDPALAPVPLRPSRAVALAGLRVSFHTDNGIAPAGPDSVAAVRSAARALAEQGAELREERPPGIEETQALYLELLAADGGHGIRQQLAAAGTREPESDLAALLALFESGPASPERIPSALARWDRFRAVLTRFLAERDAILCPVNAQPAPPHGASDGRLADFSYTMTYNLTGWPVAVVRAGTSAEGLPIGVQLVARPWREDVALALARVVERTHADFAPLPEL